MSELGDMHQALVEDNRGAFEISVGQLLAQPSWSVEAKMALIHIQE